MGGMRDDLAILGLEPGADRRAIDDAFKTLMKAHHPDRAGGDGARAAEIIRAYRSLRPGAMGTSVVEFWERPAQHGARWRWLWLGAGGLIAAAILAAMVDPTSHSGPARIGADVAEGLGLDRSGDTGTISRRLNDDVIAKAVDDARIMAERGDEMDLAQASRECHLGFRLSRDLADFDRCVAFDNAVVLLQDRDPLRDQGPFSQAAVSRRHWSAASLLSRDSLAIDSRLDQIRLEVELRLAPQVAAPPPPAG